MNPVEKLKNNLESCSNSNMNRHEFKFSSIMFGRQVRFISSKLHDEMPDFYPEEGTIGIIVHTDKSRSFDDDVKFLISWPKGSTSGNDIWQCDEDLLELVDEIVDYTPEKYGVIIAMRLFYVEYPIPYVTLVFASSGSVTIPWDIAENRNKYSCGITPYTLIYDDRVGNTKFEDRIVVRR